MLGFLFGHKPNATATAELLVNGSEILNEGMKAAKFNTYSGPEPMFDMRVRVSDSTGKLWEATMQAGPSTAYLLVPGVKVQVKYSTKKPEQVFLDQDALAIIAANPQLRREHPRG